MPSAQEKLEKIIADQFRLKESEFDPAADLVKDLGADSLDVVELTMAFEEAFGDDRP